MFLFFHILGIIINRGFCNWIYPYLGWYFITPSHGGFLSHGGTPKSSSRYDRIETMNSYWNNYGDDWGSPMTSGKPAPRLPWRERRGTRSNDAQFLPAPRETLSTNCPMDPHFLLVGGAWNMAGLFSISYMGCHPSNWRAHIFQRGRSTTNQLDFDDFFSFGGWSSWVIPCHTYLWPTNVVYFEQQDMWSSRQNHWPLQRRIFLLQMPPLKFGFPAFHLWGHDCCI